VIIEKKFFQEGALLLTSASDIGAEDATASSAKTFGEKLMRNFGKI